MFATAETLFIVLALSVIVRYLVDTVGRPLVDYYKIPHQFLAIVAVLIGEGLAFGINVPLLENGLAPWADKAVMGVLIAGGGGLINDFLKAIGYVRTQVRKPKL
jgi:hypothetical protein